MDILWTCQKFEELKNLELYKILKLRSQIFVVEQNCAYQDIDDKDEEAYHLCGWQNNELMLYVRILKPGVSYPDKSSIGRVCNSPEARGKGLGVQLMQNAIDKTRELYPNAKIKIGAQMYLLKFYNSLGFMQCSETYLEDGIEHIEMEI